MKKNLLLLHGALGTKAQFAETEKLLRNEFHTYSLSFEGHGGEKSPEGFSIRLFTENVLEFLRENQLEPINIFGYSMGGYVALNLAIQHPEKVNKIVTLGTKFNWEMDGTLKEVAILDPEKMEEKVPQFAEKLIRDHSEEWKTVVKKTAKLMLGLAQGKKLSQEDLKKIKHPVILGIGTQDRLVSHDETLSASKALANSKVVTLDEVPHPIEKIYPEIIASFIRNSFQ